MPLKILTATVIVIASVGAFVWFSSAQPRKEAISVSQPVPEQKVAVSAIDDSVDMISVGTVPKNSVKRVDALLKKNGMSTEWVGGEGRHVLVPFADRLKATKLVSEDARKSGYAFVGVKINRVAIQ